MSRARESASPKAKDSESAAADDTQSVRVTKGLVKLTGIISKLSGKSARELMDSWIEAGIRDFEVKERIKLPRIKS